MRYLPTIAVGFGGFLVAKLANKWEHRDLLRLKAQSKPACDEDEDDHDECPQQPPKSTQPDPPKSATATEAQFLWQPPCLQEHLKGHQQYTSKATAVVTAVREHDLPAQHKEYFAPKTSYECGGVIFPHPKIAKRFLLQYDDFVVCYDNSTRAPCWTLEEIRREGLSVQPSPRRYNREERLVPPDFRAGLRNYQHAFDMIKLQNLAEFDIHPESIGDPCVYTNVVAQRIENNDHCVRTVWDEFRAYVVHLSAKYKSIFILSGALYLPGEKCGKRTVHYEVLEKRLIAIPTHFFKVILYENADETFHLECYRFENKVYDSLDLRKFLVSRRELEKDAGFCIFDRVKDAKIQDWATEESFSKGRNYKPTRRSSQTDKDATL